MKENTEKNSNKRKYTTLLITLLGVLILTAATVFTVWFAVGDRNEGKIPDTPPVTPVDPVEPDKPSTGEDTVRFVNPVESVTVSGSYGFSANTTLGWFYEHQGVDIKADEGTAVLCMAKGTVKSVTTDEVYGTQIVIDHGDELCTVYRFIDAASGIKEGASVEKGQKIGTVSKAVGNEYKEGPHLHLEVLLKGVNVDPTEYLTLDEK